MCSLCSGSVKCPHDLASPGNLIYRMDFIRVLFPLAQWNLLASSTKNKVKPALQVRVLFILAFCFIFPESKIVSQMDSHQSLFWQSVPWIVQRTKAEAHLDPLSLKMRVYLLVLKERFYSDQKKELICKRLQGLRTEPRSLCEHSPENCYGRYPGDTGAAKRTLYLSCQR